MTMPDRSYTHECGCISGWKDNGKAFFTACDEHELARNNMKPYSEYVRIGRGLCSICHGYDEVINRTVCVCGDWDRRKQLNDFIKMSLSGMTVEKAQVEYANLGDEIDRVRKNRGKV